MKLILHIGTEKTGTTLIQNWLFGNRDALSRNGVFLSSVVGSPNHRDLVAFFQNDLDAYMRKKSIHNTEQKARYYSDFLERLANEIKEASVTHSNMVITSELFHSRLLKKSEIQALREFLIDNFESIKVVCYFREQSEMRKSHYSTVLKADLAVPIERFKNGEGAQSSYFNFYELAKKWSNFFGKENCDFRIYDRSKFLNGDIRYDFLSTLNIDVDINQFSFDAVSSNESLTYLQSLAYCQINKLVPYWAPEGGINAENIFWKRFVDSLGFFRKGKIVDPRQESFFDLFVESNQKLSDEFFDGRQLFKRPSAYLPSENETSNEADELLLQFLVTIIKKFRGRVLIEKNLQFLRPIVAKHEAGDRLDDVEVARLVEVLGAAIRPGKDLN